MKNTKIFILIKIIILYFFLISKSYSEIIKSFTIDGNQRLSKETIIIFSELELNQKIDKYSINEAIKKLYSTDYFKNVVIKFNDGNLLINVLENPIIQSIELNGIANKSIIKNLEQITKKSEKYPFILNNVSEQKNLLLNILRSNGFYFSQVKVRIEENTNNTINLIYDFNLGEKAKINKIQFTGNKIFKNNKLRNLIISEESRPWKFITKNIYIDEQRIDIDKRLLTNFFKNKGYYNVEVKSSFAKVVENNNFDLVFNIFPGKKYYFNEISLVLSDDYSNIERSNFNKIFNNIKNEPYSLKSIEKIIKEIDKTILQQEFVFVNAQFEEKIVDDTKININIYFDELEKSYVDKINIFGNFITEEKVLRNSLLVDEGDPYNKILFNKSINNIQSKNIFKSVKTEVLNTKKNSKNKTINITVEEKATGEIFAGAGTGTTGSTISGGINEKNYLGKGINLETMVEISDDEIKGKFSVVNPNFRNSDKSLNTTIESTSTDFMTSSGYKTTRTGFQFGTGFEQYEDLFINLNVSNYYEKLETSDNATDIKKRQEGDYLENLFSYSLMLDKLDQKFQPTNGYFTKFSQTIPIYADDNSIKNTFDASRYYSINENLILSAKFLFSAVNTLESDKNVRVSKRIFIPSSRLRGFESGSIGPKEGDQFVGGNYGSAINFNTTLPNLFKEFENVDLNLFFDAANLWHVDYDNSLDSNKIRSSTGLSVNWFTVVGPLSFSYALPLSEAKTDKTESFRFQIGTSF